MENENNMSDAMNFSLDVQVAAQEKKNLHENPGAFTAVLKDVLKRYSVVNMDDVSITFSDGSVAKLMTRGFVLDESQMENITTFAELPPNAIFEFVTPQLSNPLSPFMQKEGLPYSAAFAQRCGERWVTVSGMGAGGFDEYANVRLIEQLSYRIR